VLRYRGARLLRIGFIGIVLAVLVMLVGLSPQRLVSLATTIRHQAVFSEAGGLDAGNNVMVSGIKVGTVSKVSLHNGKAMVEFGVDGKVSLGSQTTAHIKTGTLLGRRILVLDSAGSGELKPRAVIPLSRTSSPYSLSDAVGELTTNAAGTDTNQLNQSLDTLSATLDQIAPRLGPTFDGLTRLSQSINSRDESLREMLSTAGDVTKILSERSQQLNTLILNANTLLGVLADRRNAIVGLLANTSALAKQLSGLVADNEAQLAPTLDRLNSVVALLEENRDNIAKAIPGLKKVAMTQGEAVNNGAYYNALVGNLPPGPMIQPFIDAAMGMQPRTLFPWPNCGGEKNGFLPPFNFDHCYNREESPGPFTEKAPR
jgi:phospholipid/cholesterol/gamma-HCH transport system substrate-binding protein